MKDFLIKCVYFAALVIFAKFAALLISPESVTASSIWWSIQMLGIFFSVAVIALLSDINNKLDKNK